MRACDLNTRIGGLHLANPVMVASGTFGYGREYADLVDVERLGAVVVKGVSLAPRAGNPAPRTVETPAGMLNAVGLENPGLEAFIHDKLPWLAGLATRVVVNIFGDTVEDYAALAARLDDLEGVDGLEVNISCPNVRQGGIAFGSDPDTAARVARAVREKTNKPVLVKLTPNVTDLVAIAERVAATGVDGLTLINTLRGMAIDPVTGRFMLANRIGGLSGPAIRPVAVRAVYEVAAAVDIPVVGCGGIAGWRDAVELMRAGACAVQVGSVTFRNPQACVQILEGLEAFLRESGHAACRELVGSVHRQPRDPDPSRNPGQAEGA